MILEDETPIGAAIDDVWAVTVDVERWPAWNPNVNGVRRLGDETFGEGSRVEIRQPALPAVVWTVTEFAPPCRFTWTGRAPGLAMIATHELTPSDDGTSNLLRLDVSGWAARLFRPLVRRALANALARENAGLKSRCEADLPNADSS